MIERSKYFCLSPEWRLNLVSSVVTEIRIAFISGELVVKARRNKLQRMTIAYMTLLCVNRSTRFTTERIIIPLLASPNQSIPFITHTH